MAEQEGYGKPDAIPTLRNNPLNLKHSPHSIHDAETGPDGIGKIDTIEDGWADGERQILLWANRGLNIGDSMRCQTGWTLATGDVEGNNTAEYIDFVCGGLGLGPEVSMTVARMIPSDASPAIT